MSCGTLGGSGPKLRYPIKKLLELKSQTFTLSKHECLLHCKVYSQQPLITCGRPAATPKRPSCLLQGFLSDPKSMLDL